MNTPPSYAPTTSYTASSNTANLQEVSKSSLVKSSVHKTVYNSLAEIYSILPTLEMIENSYLKDYITDEDKYTSTSYRLINQHDIIVKGFKSDPTSHPVLRELLGDQLNEDLSNFLALFTTKFNIQLPLAIKRLESGFPSTIANLNDSNSSLPAVGNSSGGNHRLIAEITGDFITCMDALKLNFKLKDQLHPLLSDLVIHLNALIESNSDKGRTNVEFPGKSKLVTWLIRLNNLESNGELNEEDINLFLQDLDVAYKGFYSSLL